MKSFALSSAFLCLCTLFFRCGYFAPIAGDTSETGNTYITGMVTLPSGKVAPNTQVTLLPVTYNPVQDGPVPNSMIDTTRETGKYSFAVKTPGRYTIQAVQLDQRTRALVTAGIIVAAAVDTIRVAEAVLRNPGALRVVLPNAADTVNGYTYIPGTTLMTRITGDTAIIDSVPAGFILAVNYHNAADSTENHVIISGFTISPGATTTVVDYSAWTCSKKLYLNTTVTGLYVGGTVYGFPVLVQLNAGNFNFSQANADGADLRFVKPDGTPLPYEIERWDPGAGRAEVWVKVDTIHGNNNTQSIMMRYGNTKAVSESNGAAVFDTANGFVGVWHLNENNGLKAFDATYNRYDGIVSPTSPVKVAGTINMAKQFNGKSTYFCMPFTANSKLNFQENGNYSISAWVSPDTTTPSRQSIVSKGELQYSLLVQDSFCAFPEFKNLLGWETARSTPSMTCIAVTPKTWILVTGIRAGNRQYLYIDDCLCTDTTNEFIASAQPRVTGTNLNIGRFEDMNSTGSCYFSGVIDEVRISRIALNEDWVRLSFRNQIGDGALVRFE